MGIEELWRKRLRVLMANLAEGSREHEEIHNLSREVTLDYHGRFLIELIQNAVDALQEGHVGTLHIVLTPTLLAVLNQGQPFSAEGLESITSMALSPKRADESIGNKGIGFKSVFEVSDAPELYSVASPAHSLRQVKTTSWRISRKPLEEPLIEAYAEQLISTLLAADPPLKGRLQKRFPGRVKEAVLEGFRCSAPFRYPLSLSEENFRARVNELQLSEELLGQFQTLVVLPLTPGARKQVVQVFEQQLEKADSLMVFLPRAGSVTFVQHKIGGGRKTVHVRRCDGPLVQTTQATLWVREVSVSVRVEDPQSPTPRRNAAPQTSVTEKEDVVRHWMATTYLETRGNSALEQALKSLETQSWSRIQRLGVSVALRFPDNESLKMSSSGYFVVGLPTQVETGVPISMDSHFYASLSRTRLDLDLPLNRLLFEAGVGLVEVLWQQLQAWPGLSAEDSLLAKLAATLLFTKSKGPLADALFSSGGLARRAVVLRHDEADFLQASQVTLPASEDLPLMRQMCSLGAAFSPEPWGYALPHPKLDAHLSLLKALGATQEKTEHKSMGDTGFFTELPHMGTLIHHWARQGRKKGPQFWEPFLTWVLKRCDEKDLNKQIFLPTGTSALSSPEALVMLPPLESALQGEPSRSEIPPRLVAHLNFLDECCIRLRDADGQLSSQGYDWVNEARQNSFLSRYIQDRSSVRPFYLPTRKRLLETALPRALEAAQRSGEQETCFELLRLLFHWSAGPASDQQVKLPTLYLPTNRGTWEKAETLVLGQGWCAGLPTETLQEAVLEPVYGASGRRLLPWAEFARKVQLSAEELPKIRSWVEDHGVLARPFELTLLECPLVNYKNGRAVPCEITSPLPALAPEWSEYLDYLTNEAQISGAREVDKQTFRVLWIEGLEVPALRLPLVELLLQNPKGLTLQQSFRVSYSDHPYSPWWIIALRRWGLDRVPTALESWTAGALTPARQVCILSPEERQSLSLRLLPHIAKAQSNPLLEALGVQPLLKQTESWWIERLEQVAELLSLGSLKPSPQVEALVMQLYGWLDKCFAPYRRDAGPGEQKLLNSRLPFWRGDTLSFGRLADESVFYIEDRVYPTRCIPQYERRLHLPLPTGQELKSCIAILQALPGGPKLVRTSQAPLVVPVQAPRRCDQPLLDWLSAALNRPDLRQECAVLLVAAGGRPDKLESPQRLAWERLTACALSFGLMPEELQSFYHEQEQTLYASMLLTSHPEELLPELWPILGIAWRDAWEAGAARILRGRSAFDGWLKEKRITAVEREKICLALNVEMLAPTLLVTASASENSPPRKPAEHYTTSPDRWVPVRNEAAPAPAPAEEAPPAWLELLLASRETTNLTDILCISRPESETEAELERGVSGPDLAGEESVADDQAAQAVGEPSVARGGGTASRRFKQVSGVMTITGGSLRAMRASVKAQSRKERLPEDTFVMGPTPLVGEPQVYERHPHLEGLTQRFAFEHLKRLVPGFDGEHWQSAQRVHAGLAAPESPATGFHFQFLDTAGALVQPPGQHCFLWVCGVRGAVEPWQRLPGEVWHKAVECHATEGQCFILLLVTHLGSEPCLAALIEDPVAQVLCARLPAVLDHLWLGLEALMPKPITAAESPSQLEPRSEPDVQSASAAALDLPRAHTGKVVEWHWRSRKGYTYSQTSWDCCGESKGQSRCSRTPGRYHPGKPQGSGSRRGGGGGYGFWSCCLRALREPGCQDEDSVHRDFE